MPPRQGSGNLPGFFGGVPCDPRPQSLVALCVTFTSIYGTLLFRRYGSTSYYPLHVRRQGHCECFLARQHERHILGRFIVRRLADEEGVDLIRASADGEARWTY